MTRSPNSKSPYTILYDDRPQADRPLSGVMCHGLRELPPRSPWQRPDLSWGKVDSLLRSLSLMLNQLQKSVQLSLGVPDLYEASGHCEDGGERTINEGLG